ncbi:DoxX family protein [Parafrigoribacterium soli]|uniref:DoxX family protein n=1 Tax=Parafrigoribacterium soli TaxID=3144663 RepID=UPI0032EB3FA6
MNVGKLLLRVVVGSVFLGHGLQKLTGSFGGPGLAGTEKMAEHLDLHPPRRNALAVALTETTGGAAMLAGAATPLAGAGLIATMLTAVRKVHLKNGPWNSNGGYEYNAVLIAAVASLAGGPGKASIDALFGKSNWGIKGTLFALGAGVAGSLAVVALGRLNAPAGDAAAAAPEPKAPEADSSGEVTESDVAAAASDAPNGSASDES